MELINTAYYDMAEPVPADSLTMEARLHRLILHGLSIKKVPALSIELPYEACDLQNSVNVAENLTFFNMFNTEQRPWAHAIYTLEHLIYKWSTQNQPLQSLPCLDKFIEDFEKQLSLQTEPVASFLLERIRRVAAAIALLYLGRSIPRKQAGLDSSHPLNFLLNYICVVHIEFKEVLTIAHWVMTNHHISLAPQSCAKPLPMKPDDEVYSVFVKRGLRLDAMLDFLNDTTLNLHTYTKIDVMDSITYKGRNLPLSGTPDYYLAFGNCIFWDVSNKVISVPPVILKDFYAYHISFESSIDIDPYIHTEAASLGTFLDIFTTANEANHTYIISHPSIKKVKKQLKDANLPEYAGILPVGKTLTYIGFFFGGGLIVPASTATACLLGTIYNVNITATIEDVMHKYGDTGSKFSAPININLFGTEEQLRDGLESSPLNDFYFIGS